LVLDGAIAGETAMADSLLCALTRLLTRGWGLLAFYAWAVLWGLIGWGEPAAEGAPSDRRAAATLVANAFLALAAARVYRRGIRARERGHARCGDGWPLLAQVLGAQVARVDPSVVRFYSNPAHFQTTAWLELDGPVARAGSFLATLLTGQGLYERGRRFDARFRTFRRADGSMHFVREIYCGPTLRVFDSDFVVRDEAGRPTLYEVFPELGLTVAMEVTALEGGALSIRSRSVRLHGVQLPTLGLGVEFVVHRQGDALAIDGQLRFRQGALACIHYWARPVPGGQVSDGETRAFLAASPEVAR
jgi:hypothetical protein